MKIIYHGTLKHYVRKAVGTIESFATLESYNINLNPISYIQIDLTQNSDLKIMCIIFFTI